MHRNFRALIVAVAVTLFAAPAFADTLTCTVTAPGLRLRQSPSKGAKVIAILKKDTQLVAAGKCSGGWVKVASGDGKLSGYVGGWAIAPSTPGVVAALAVHPAPVQEAAHAEPLREAVAPQVQSVPRRTVPGNEQLAIQITELRLNVLGIERELDTMKKEIRQIQTTVASRSRQKIPTVGTRKGRRDAAKKG